MKKLTGRHVLFGLLAFFGVIAAVNAVFMTFALRTFPGVEAEKSYREGLAYNETLEARRAQDALHWSAFVDQVALSGGGAEFLLRIEGADGVSITGLSVDGVLRHPADKSEDRSLAFTRVEDGYAARLNDAPPGRWMLIATTRSPNGDEFVAQREVTIR